MDGTDGGDHGDRDRRHVRTCSTPLLTTAALASGAAGLVHAAAAGTHTGDGVMVALFAGAAAAQLGWAALAVARPGRPTAALGGVLGAVLGGAWLASRTPGWPMIDTLAEPASFGTQDSIAAVLGTLSAGLAGLAVAGLTVPRLLRSAPVAALSGVALLALAVPGVMAEHDHGHDGADDHATTGGGEAAAGLDHPVADDHAGDDGAAGGDGHAAEQPFISLTDTRLTATQRQAAQTVIDDTVAGMAPYRDVASVEAAGYVSIGDGRTGYEHFVNFAHLVDGTDLDPARIESVVFKVDPDGTRQLASAMYILSPGMTMDDVPDIAGGLTTWHDHQDLCWEGTRVVGTVGPDGTCSNGTFRPTPPMLHVWMLPHECGPFAGLEGSHGGGCAHGRGDEDPEVADATLGSGGGS
jgi:hypothetical protein